MMGGFGMGLGWILGILLIGVIIWAVMKASGNGLFQSNRSGGSSAPENALDILKKRYAKGEISREQFNEMKNNIEK